MLAERCTRSYKKWGSGPNEFLEYDAAAEVFRYTGVYQIKVDGNLSSTVLNQGRRAIYRYRGRHVSNQQVERLRTKASALRWQLSADIMGST